MQSNPGSTAVPPAPTSLTAVDTSATSCCNGSSEADPDIAQFVVSRSLNGGPWKPVGVQRAGVTRYVDWIGDPQARAVYRISGAHLGAGRVRGVERGCRKRPIR